MKRVDYEIPAIQTGENVEDWKMRTKVLPQLCALVLYLLLSYLAILLFDRQTIVSLTKEDGLFETLGALFFLGASVFSFIIFVKDTRANDLYFLQTNRNLFFLMLAFVFFTGFGEEISWGQRLFHLQTPEVLKQVNTQDEINIHNLSIFHGTNADGDTKSFWGLMLNVDRLFSFFWFIYCFIIPILDKTIRNISKRLRIVNLPIVPVWTGVVFALNYLFSKIFELYIGDDLRHCVVEIKESNFSFLFCVACFWFLKRLQTQAKGGLSVNSHTWDEDVPVTVGGCMATP